MRCVNVRVILVQIDLRAPDIFIRQHACSEEFRACSAVHRAFDRLQAVDLAFCLAVAPGQFDGVADGADVTAQDPREPDDRGEPGADGIVEPNVELARFTAPENAAKSHGKAAHQGKLMGSLLQGVHLARLIDRQHASRLHAKGGCDYRRDHMAGLRIPYRDSIAARLIGDDRSRRRTVLDRPLGAAPACEKPLEIRKTARVAALLDIVKQMPSAAIAIFPALGEKRLEI